MAPWMKILSPKVDGFKVEFIQLQPKGDKEMVYHFLCVVFSWKLTTSPSQLVILKIIFLFYNGRGFHTNLFPFSTFRVAKSLISHGNLWDVSITESSPRWEVNLLLQLAPEEGNLNGQAIPSHVSIQRWKTTR